MSDAATINKLILLYLLDHADFPLSSSQVSDLLVSRGYIAYFPLQELISELSDSDLLTISKDGMRTLYTITEKGRETVSYFESRLTEELREEIRDYLRLNRLTLQAENDVSASFSPSEDGAFMVHGNIRENGRDLLTLSVQVPTAEEAERLSLRWKDRAQEIYASVMQRWMES